MNLATKHGHQGHGQLVHDNWPNLRNFWSYTLLHRVYCWHSPVRCSQPQAEKHITEIVLYAEQEWNEWLKSFALQEGPVRTS